MILLVAAMDSEVNEILPHLELISSKPYPIYEGQIQSKNVALIITGVGKTNASSALTYLITLYPHAKLIINLGIVGGYKVLLHETYIVCESTYHDVDLTVFNYEKGQIPNFPTIYLPDT